MSLSALRAPAIRASTVIAAPIDVVWSILVDTESYGQWNPFITCIRTPEERAIRSGDELRLDVRWSGGGGVCTTEIVTQIEPPEGRTALLAWAYGGPIASLGLVRGTREQRLVSTGPSLTRYETQEQLRGPLARLTPRRRVQAGFECSADALRERAEALVSQ